MKKFFISAFAAILFGALAVPAMAVDFGGQLMTRGEFRSNNNFQEHNNGGDGLQAQDSAMVFQRTRLSATGNPTDTTKVRITIQDTNTWGTHGLGNLTDTGANHLDLKEAYWRENGIFGTPLDIQIGRQVISYDDQRLLGGFEWNQSARAFDAVKVMYGSEAFDVDVFAAKVTEGGGGAGTNSDVDLYGVHATIKTIPNNSLSVYTYILQDAAGTFTGGSFLSGSDSPVSGATTTLYTIGARLKGAFSGLDYTLELPFQTGTTGEDDISAYAFAGRIGYTLPGAQKVRIGGEIAYASGDNDLTDTDMETFVNLFPTNHAHYGSMDNQSWRNTISYNLNVSAKATSQLKLIASVWFFNLAQEEDALYGVSGAATGFGMGTDTTVGSELDLTAVYKYNKAVTLKGGYSHYFISDVIQVALPDSTEDDEDWAWLMAVVNF